MKRMLLMMYACGFAFGSGLAAQAQESVDPTRLPSVPPKEVDTPPPPPDPTPTEGPGSFGIVPAPAPIGVGQAQDPGPIVPRAAAYATPIGGALLVGGGFEDFTNNNLRGMTSGGGAWTARAIAGTREFVGLEAAYVGAARSIDTLGLDTNARLISNGVEGALRLNIPVMLRGQSLIEPFGFVGLGWQHYNVSNSNSNTSDLADTDDVMSLPVGGGLEFAYRRFIADARFTYRETFYNDLLRTSGGKLNNWGVSGQLGVAF